ncbi:uncharacterized protein B0H18DRAFT_1048054 [Fomitopsis serialis]|nr:uncharacterized protein B0H18DRAFT_1048054 [Neoantrodia serialis]KAH9913531.1 hypothetical protein B0H18DRAFT_1048054 [Neoantrodia serialis]
MPKTEFAKGDLVYLSRREMVQCTLQDIDEEVRRQPWKIVDNLKEPETSGLQIRSTCRRSNFTRTVPKGDLVK